MNIVQALWNARAADLEIDVAIGSPDAISPTYTWQNKAGQASAKARRQAEQGGLEENTYRAGKARRVNASSFNVQPLLEIPNGTPPGGPDLRGDMGLGSSPAQ